jgi:hypothetical protein
MAGFGCPPRDTSLSVQLISRTLPWFEITIGVLASLFFDVIVVRLLVLGLFSLFLIALLGLSVRFKRFDCGCFGTGHAEAREIILIRAIASLLAAVYFVLSPSSVFTIQQTVWFECGAWASVFLIIVGLHARELIGDQTWSAQP